MTTKPLLIGAGWDDPEWKVAVVSSAGGGCRVTITCEMTEEEARQIATEGLADRNVAAVDAWGGAIKRAIYRRGIQP